MFQAAAEGMEILHRRSKETRFRAARPTDVPRTTSLQEPKMQVVDINQKKQTMWYFDVHNVGTDSQSSNFVPQKRTIRSRPLSHTVFDIETFGSIKRAIPPVPKDVTFREFFSVKSKTESYTLTAAQQAALETGKDWFGFVVWRTHGKLISKRQLQTSYGGHIGHSTFRDLVSSVKYGLFRESAD
ncbi:hypothetical protein H2202_002610 [Exophiala xenobiotica]|nr:hypothetical protein H2202_002610 [Exophiala xenobiotica]